jgi:hypothetical protein
MRGKWPGAPDDRDHYSVNEFSTTYARTLDLLQREVSYLEGTHVVFQLEVSSDDIRQDGGLYAHARPAHPGIVVTFNSKYGPLSYYSDEYGDWRSNLRAITLAMQYLRKIDDHGVNKKGTQYEGYKRLPPVGETTNGRKVGFSTDQEAAAFIEKHFPALTADQILSSSPLFETAYKQAARKLHPDAGGNEEDWIDLQEAAARLTEMHKKKA